MGWTHDYRDAANERGADAATALTISGQETTGYPRHDARIGIPRIIRRRARWVSARLRHPRNR